MMKHNLNKDQFKCSPTLATKESIFDEKLYQQLDSVSMDSPEAPRLATTFLSLLL